MANSRDIGSEHRAAWKRFQEGNLKGAWQLSQALNRNAPGFLPGWDLSSRVALALGDPSAALTLINRAREKDADSFAYASQKAYCLLALRRLDEANAIIQNLEQCDAKSAPEYDTLGNLYSQGKDQASAQRCFEHAVELDPGKSHYFMNLGLARQANGDLDGAEIAFDKAVGLNPQDHETWLHRSRLRKQTSQRNHVEQIKTRITLGFSSWRGEVSLRYALAKEYEDLNDYAQSFEQLQQGASVRRSHMQYDSKADLDAINDIIDQFPVDSFAEENSGHDSHEPIFIVGLPRTGTTLVERILGSHSAVFAAGELNNFAENLTRQVALLPSEKPANRRQFIAAAARVDYGALGETYVSSTRPHTGHTSRFIDKLPLNFLYCGLIHKALPNARIINLTRHPMDTCYAMYKTLFKHAYPFSYDQQELAQYYLAYRKLMTHWHEALPGKILDISYEQLTCNFADECRNILSFCDLPWEDSCLEFHKNAAPSMTSSLAQVRQPVYTSSIGRWRNYREELSPMEAVFTAAGLTL